MAVEFDEHNLHELYSWVDKIPLSRPKRNITRDFSDGVLAAEVVKFYFPKLVEMHNYVPANSPQQKISNWTILNKKVLSKMSFSVPDDVIRKVVQCSPGVVELVLNTLRQKIEEKQKQLQANADTSQEMSPRPQPANHTEPDLSFPNYGLQIYDGVKTYDWVQTYDGVQAYKEVQMYNRVQTYDWVQMYDEVQAHNGVQTKQQQGYAQAANADTSMRIQLAEKEQALMEAQENLQILQAKLRRMEQLVHLKNVRIDDLTRRLQEAEKK
ncbi:sperm flagellar protein 1 [Pyxicephalus adspersus]|uniref:sperm flagellar protein 1 n=1 Tax=Pyxicephalus adspersus TaxID=30357 RepID=UPI003B5AE565